MLHITEKEVIKNYSMTECIQDVKQAFELVKSSHVDTPYRTLLRHDDKGAHTLYMPSFVEGINYSSVKVSSLYPENRATNIPVIQSVILLSDGKTGQHLALIEASYLTAIRTGAITGLGTSYLARKDARKLGVIGCGSQSYSQVEAVLTVRDVDQLFLYNRTQKKADDLKARLLADFPDKKLDIIVVNTPEDAIKDADIVISSTSADRPVFSSELIKAGTHLSAIGSCEPTKQEYDADLLKKAKKVVVDTYEGAKSEAGGLIIPHEKGEWSFDSVHSDLAELVANERPGRETETEITLLDSVGVGFLDTVCAATIYEKIKGK